MKTRNRTRTRALIFLENLDLGGAERQAMLLARHLKEVQQMEVQVWGMKSPGPVRAMCDALGIPWRLLPWPSGRNPLARLFGMMRCAWALRQAKPNIVLPYTAWPNLICGLAWRWAGAHTCIWNQRDEGIALTGRWLERQAVANTPTFVANSQAGADFLSKLYGLPNERVQIIHNGIQLAAAKRDRAQWRSQLKVDAQAPLVCMVANLTRYKDHPTLLRAWQRVSAAVPHARLLLAGRLDHAADENKALAQELGISAHVDFLGQVDDITGLLQASDVLVHSSRAEGSPNAVLEGMAVGLPVVATDILAIRDAVGPAGLAWLTPPGDADAMADKIIALLQHPDQRQHLGQTLQRRIEDEFALERMCARMVALMADEGRGRRTEDGRPMTGDGRP